ncbi:MAG: EthD family reductase [Caldilineales bacterium]|nr:EthD family reductase [Caldilineales bacterium]
MLKVISLLKRKEDMSLDDFRKWAMEEHPPLGKKLPGLRHYRMSVAVKDNPDAPADAVSEFWFDDEAARVAAFSTPEGAAAAADAAAHCSFRIHLFTEEKVILE